MGQRGPLPKQLPENVAMLRAEVTHSTPKVATAKLRPVPPKKPGWLGEYGAKVWDRVVKELDPLGLLSPVDGEILAAYCDTAEMAFMARKDMLTNGPTLTSSRGDIVKNPAWTVFTQASAHLDRLGTKLALNPSARLRMLHDLDDLDLSDTSDLD